VPGTEGLGDQLQPGNYRNIKLSNTRYYTVCSYFYSKLKIKCWDNNKQLSMMRDITVECNRRIFPPETYVAYGPINTGITTGYGGVKCPGLTRLVRTRVNARNKSSQLQWPAGSDTTCRERCFTQTLARVPGDWFTETRVQTCNGTKHT
jgi:hypothetical protein